MLACFVNADADPAMSPTMKMVQAHTMESDGQRGHARLPRQGLFTKRTVCTSRSTCLSFCLLLFTLHLVP